MPRNKKNRDINRLPKGLLLFLGMLIVLSVFFMFSINVTPPKVPVLKHSIFLTKINDSLVTCNKSWIKKNKDGLWELFIEGSPYERGLTTGALTQNLSRFQEYAFVNEIVKMIPSKSYLDFLKYFIAFFNRNLDQSIPNENLLEMYGISHYMSNDYSFIGPAYLRVLNYHAAHDIGHALVNYHMVGCTSFAVKNSASADSSLLIARNFDFYVGDNFAKNKIIAFIVPDSGYKFMNISWGGGMTGVLSGMNEKGLTVTINAASSDIPYSAATPISIVTRNILQYAKNIKEAIAIATRFKTFVSESILIGSAEDNNAILIEKSPTRQFVYSSPNDYLICTNHFQSDSFMTDKRNLENMLNSPSLYRYFRVKELIKKNLPVSTSSAATILRDRNGIRNQNIGMCNEKSINQLIAHHSIIFKPKQRIVWVSTYPFQLGKYIAYDLNKIFNDTFDIRHSSVLNEQSLTINCDPFLYSKEYKSFKVYKLAKEYISFLTRYPSLGTLSEKTAQSFISSNPEYYYTYQVIGNYYKSRNENDLAIKSYKIALTKEVTSVNDKKALNESIKECEVQ
jgi:isopenicillin-N N-acyltransferase like protein